MKNSLARLLIALLAGLMLAATAAAQGSEGESAPGAVTEPAAPASTAPDTDLPGTDAPDTAAPTDPVVIQVGSTVERASELEWRFEVATRSLVAQQGMPYGPEVALQLRPLLPTYVEQRAQELALVVEARARGLTADEESIDGELETLRASVESDEQYHELLRSAGFPGEEQVRQMLVEADIVNQLVQELRAEAEAGATDAVLRTRFLADRAFFQEDEAFCARHILVAEEELAQELLERLDAGEEFADLAAEYGTDGTRTRGGDLGCFGRGAMVADFEQAVLDAEVGTPSGPVATQFGYHVVLVYDHTPARVPSFDEVREEVRNRYVGLATEAAIDGIIAGSGARSYPERMAP